MSKKSGFLSFFLIGELSRQPREAAGVCAVTLLGLHLLATSKVVMLQTLQIGARWLPVLSGHLLFLQCSAWGSAQRLGVVSSVQPFCWLWAVSAALPLPDAAKPGMFLLIHDTTGQEYDAEDLRFGCSSVARVLLPGARSRQCLLACKRTVWPEASAYVGICMQLGGLLSCSAVSLLAIEAERALFEAAELPPSLWVSVDLLQPAAAPR